MSASNHNPPRTEEETALRILGGEKYCKQHKIWLEDEESCLDCWREELKAQRKSPAISAAASRIVVTLRND